MMSAPTTTAPEAIAAIERLYEFREPEEVRAFLAKNPDLIDLVIEAAAKIPEFLPPDGRIVLDVVWDPEDEKAEDELFALVPTRLGWEEVRPLMGRLDREWLVETFRLARGRFNVDVEYY
jgi:hypothetical protein